MLKRTLTVVLNVILVLLLAIGLFIVGSLLPIKNSYKILSVISGSMEPTIAAGSVVVIFPKKAYFAGDIITFKQSKDDKNVFTTHRLVSSEEKDGRVIFKTKGDANEKDDFEPVEPSSVVGKVAFSVAYLGYVISSIKSLPGLLLIIIIPATIIIYEQVKTIHKETKEILRKKVEAKQSLIKKAKKISKKKTKIKTKEKTKKMKVIAKPNVKKNSKSRGNKNEK